MSSTPSLISIAERLRVETEQWEKFAWQLRCALRVAVPGIVVSFDPVKQTVSVRIAIREHINQNLVVTPVEIDVLQDVPIAIPRAGGFAVTLPIVAGDECLLIFSDTCIEAWQESGGVQNQLFPHRRHDLSDAVAWFGIWSQPRKLSAYSTNSTQLRTDDGTSYIELKPGVINLNAATINLNGAVNTSGTTIIQGKTFLTHTHNGVQTGGGVSGPVT